MSEFTSGVLFRNNHIETVKMLALNHKVHILNPNWSVIVIPYHGNEHEPAISRLKDFSKACPLLNFWHAGDHGWGYQVYSDGKLRGSIDVRYGLDYYLRCEVAEVRYPNECDIIIFWNQHPEIADALMREVQESEEYKRRVRQMYGHKNVEAFAIFEIHSALIQQLDALLTADNYFESELEQVETFKQLMGFPEMTWEVITTYRLKTEHLHMRNQ